MKGNREKDHAKKWNSQDVEGSSEQWYDTKNSETDNFKVNVCCRANLLKQFERVKLNWVKTSWKDIVLFMNWIINYQMKWNRINIFESERIEYLKLFKWSYEKETIYSLSYLYNNYM